MLDTLLIVVAALAVITAIVVTAASRSRAARSAGMLPPPADLQDHLQQLVAGGRKVQAIKVLRERAPGIGLKQAKAVVDAVERGTALHAALAASGHRPPPTPAIPPDLRDHLLRLIAQGRKIEAIKVLRGRLPSLGLKQAKDIVDSLQAGTPALGSRTPPPGIPAATADLADRVRALKAQGRQEQAIHLVRGETGMDDAEATAFVNAIDPDPDAT
ncbi:Ribosomal protein L7/L12 C-terminal domain-containing protein [Nonomuraea maritima]|uniref:Ribosomal protein L7/L12 C-terminal domain-containing protein n=1 Tax=Nonomuraea maritima TaxID=683260 RepID=A0A1G9K3R8_9ACTN|nr:hypothetical protein [Nonomuraea maritima]SDL44431.1 Ribosomal protein L7/L12 C-terminal domain-containing protein [Nonomuraea maritima]